MKQTPIIATMAYLKGKMALFFYNLKGSINILGEAILPPHPGLYMVNSGGK